MNPLGLSSLLGGGIGLISGLFQRGKANRLLGQLKRPDYEIPPEAIQAASEGLPSEQYSQAMRNIQSQQASSIAAAQDRRAALGMIGRTQNITNNAVGNLDARNAEARANNIRRLAGYREKAWDWNKRQKFDQDRNYAMSLLGAGNQNILGGADRIGAGIGYMAYGSEGRNRGGGSNGVPTPSNYGYTGGDDERMPQ